MSGPRPYDLDPADLHPSVDGPAPLAVGYLNEIMARHPRAVSFAPGAPHPRSYADIDLGRHLERFLTHAVQDLGHPPDAARRLLYEYGPGRGLINHLVADALHRDHGIRTAPEALVITVGAQEALLLVLRALFRSATDVLAVAEPCFVGVTGAAHLLGVGLEAVPETDRGPDLDALLTACRAARRSGRRIRACYVAPDFSNPGGNRMDLDARLRLLRLAAEEEFLVLEDNAYGFTAAPGRELPPLKALDTEARVVHIGTFAKVCFPGARVGYVVADQRVRAPDGSATPLAAGLARLKTMVSVNTSPVCQAVIGGMLLEHGGSLAGPVGRRAALYRRNLAHLLDALDRQAAEGLPPGITWNRPEAGFFVRVALPVRADEALLRVSASRYGVLWTPMAPFYLGDGGDRALRLSCSYLEPERIEIGAARLGAFLRAEARP
ncbi:PLP-dependent aminotransferase family protein [Streptomyces lavendulae]|uniref:aminotransferase-like domain-containing protein n=1 Tax=Streptomyces lavendulae TaxID=1914 RepID=UPI003692FAB8